MVDIIIAFDEKDRRLGFFFEACKNQLALFLKSASLLYIEANSDKLNELSINSLTQNLSNFIFSAYSHGDEESLLKSGRYSYLSIAQNGANFSNSFIYSFSCKTGKKLGREIINYGCHCFIGYRNTVFIWTHRTSIFVQCANHGLIEFLKGNDSQTAFNLMIEKYNEQIDLIYKFDFEVASDLRANRDALIMHGRAIGLKEFILDV